MTRPSFRRYVVANTRITEILSSAEFIKRDDEAMRNGFYRQDKRIFLPGTAWYQDWIYDPSGERLRTGKHVMIKSPDAGNRKHLSEYYWNDWSHIRPPMCVVCPNGELWEIDRVSSNGPGWRVTGPLPFITCAPSIVVDGYHGFLEGGVFSRDLEGRGINGISKENRIIQ